MRYGRLGAILLAPLLVALSAGPSIAQTQPRSEDFQTWSAVFVNGAPLGGAQDLLLWYDGHVRRGDAGTTVIVRPALGYAVSSWLSVWTGYAWVPVSSDESGERVDEHRAWQQFILTSAWLDGALRGQARTRLEQRFHDSTSTIGHRLRQFVRFDYRFGRRARWGAVVWDELFWGLHDAGFAPEGYDQNRVFVGPAFFAAPDFRVEFGYLWVDLRREPVDQTQHALALNFFVSL